MIFFILIWNFLNYYAQWDTRVSKKVTIGWAFWKINFYQKQQLWSDRFFFMSSSMRDNLGSVVLFIFVLIHDKGLDKIILHKLDVSFKLCPLPTNIEVGLKRHLSSWNPPFQRRECPNILLQHLSSIQNITSTR